MLLTRMQRLKETFRQAPKAIDQAKHAQQPARAHILQVQLRTLQAERLLCIVMNTVIGSKLQVLGLGHDNGRIARSRRTTVGGLGCSRAASLEQRLGADGQSRSLP